MSSWTASAPLRADLAGGTLDLWPLYLLHRGASTVNVALRLKARAVYESGGKRWQLRAGDRGARRELSASRLSQASRSAPPGDPFALVLAVLEHAGTVTPGRITTRVEGPPGAGIGGSSALLIALCGLTSRVLGKRLARARLASLARDIEAQVLRFPTGLQDYYAAIYGGCLQLHYGPGGARVERLPVDLGELEARLLLAYSGKPHASARSNWRLYRRRIEADAGAVEAFEQIVTAAQRAGNALRCANWRALGRAMDADWSARMHLDPGLAPPDLRRVETAARDAGVAGGKCCGAASGGCMVFLLKRPQDRDAVSSAVEAVGAQVLSSRTARRGLTVRSGAGPSAIASDRA